MIPKRGDRFSEKIMLHETLRATFNLPKRWALREMNDFSLAGEIRIQPADSR